MTHYMIELALWMLVIFLIGCLLGFLLRRMFGSDSSGSVQHPVSVEHRTVPVQPVPPATPSEPAAPVMPVAPVTRVEPVVPPSANPAAVPMQPVGRMERPRGLDAPRGGKPDDLLLIRGIGPKNQKILHTLGFFHFDQIAAWTAEQIDWVDDHLKFNGRIGREEWVEQARLLHAGNDEEFERRFGAKRSK